MDIKVIIVVLSPTHRLGVICDCRNTFLIQQARVHSTRLSEETGLHTRPTLAAVWWSVIGDCLEFGVAVGKICWLVASLLQLAACKSHSGSLTR